MKGFTVIGIYTSSGQTTADFVEAESGEDAMRKCVVLPERGIESDDETTFEPDADFNLVVAIEGTSQLSGSEFTWPGEGVVDAVTYMELGIPPLPEKED